MIPANTIGKFRIERKPWGIILWEGDRYWMDDSEKEKESHQFAIDAAEGRVVVGGLGLGRIVEWLQAKPEVTEIVVVEIAKEVIDLVWRYLDVPKATIVHMDLKDYLVTAEGFDYIYMDVAPKAGHESIKEWRKLAEQLVAPDRVFCWGEKEMANVN